MLGKLHHAELCYNWTSITMKNIIIASKLSNLSFHVSRIAIDMRVKGWSSFHSLLYAITSLRKSSKNLLRILLHCPYPPKLIPQMNGLGIGTPCPDLWVLGHHVHSVYVAEYK